MVCNLVFIFITTILKKKLQIEENTPIDELSQ